MTTEKISSMGRCCPWSMIYTNSGVSSKKRSKYPNRLRRRREKKRRGIQKGPSRLDYLAALEGMEEGVKLSMMKRKSVGRVRAMGDDV
jgi:hypothetical protein